MVAERGPKELIEDFIEHQVVRRGLDERTEKAYRLDLEHFYRWLEKDCLEKNREHPGKSSDEGTGGVLDGSLDGGTRGVLEGSLDGGTGGALEGEIGGVLSGSLDEGARGVLGKPQDLEMIGATVQPPEAEIRKYLEHLSMERGLRPSTVARKSRVIGYYLEYLTERGIISGGLPVRPFFYLKSLVTRPVPSDPPLQPSDLSSDFLISSEDLPAGRLLPSSALLPDPVQRIKEEQKETEGAPRSLTKGEIDAIFQALQREYVELESDFRRRICLRDLVMLGLLFYHGIEVSELLRICLSNYDQKNGVLSIPRKRGKAEQVYLYSRALREWMGGWLKEHVYFEREEAYRDRLFLSKLGKPLSMKMVINIFDKYRVMAGIETAYTPKDLKNSMERYARELVVERCS